LLDVVEALGPQRDAIVLVGAQAVYLNVGDAREPLSSFTKDADLAVNPALLADEPALEAILHGAGFNRREQPGLWFNRDGSEVDLLVPASIAGAGRRSVDLGANHDKLVAMRAAGLEAALVDNHRIRLTALNSADRRSFNILVAGPAALLIAKLYKLGERADSAPDRLLNKDASDVFLLLRGTTTAGLAATLQELKSNPATSGVTNQAVRFLEELFVAPGGVGLNLLRDAVAGFADEELIVESCATLASDLVQAIASLESYDEANSA
jgi:hypothetical protein